MRARRLRPVIVVGLGLSLILSACVSSSPPSQASPSAAGSGRATSTPAPLALTYGFGAVCCDLTEEPLYLASALGYPAEEGLNLTIKEYNGDTVALRALLVGDSDVIWVGLTAAILAKEAGADLKVLYCPIPKATNVILAQTAIKTVGDLKGKNIAVSAPGAVSYDIPRIIMSRHGVDPDSAKYAALGGTSARLQALTLKQVDAAMVTLTAAAIALPQFPNLHVLANVAVEIPDFLFLCVVTTATNVAQKKDALVRLTSTELRGARYAAANPDKAAQLSTASRMKDISLAIVSQGYRDLAELRALGVNGGMDPNDPVLLQATIQIMIALGEVTHPISAGSMFAPDILRSALAHIGVMAAP